MITNATVTGYCLCRLCCGSHATGLDATGHKPRQGITVAIPRAYQLGSSVFIGGHKYRGTDRTAKKFDGRFDIYFQSHSDAMRFGKQTKSITVKTPNK